MSKTNKKGSINCKSGAFLTKYIFDETFYIVIDMNYMRRQFVYENKRGRRNEASYINMFAHGKVHGTLSLR